MPVGSVKGPVARDEAHGEYWAARGNLVIHRFEGLELDEETFELRLRGEPLKLEPRALDVLLYLAKNRDRVVPKEELLEKVWGVRFVSESALFQAVKKARQAVAEATPEEVIRTVHGRGFRFVAVLEPAGAGEPGPGAAAGEPTPAAPLAAAPAAAAAAVAPPARRLLVPAVALAAAAAGLLVLVQAGGRFRSAPPAPASPSRPPAAAGAPLRQLTSGLATAVKPAFSPDGKVLLYVSYEPESSDRLDVYVMPSQGGTSWRLTERVHASGDLPVFSADSREIVFTRFRTGADGTHLPDLWRVGSMGGPPRLWVEGATGAGFSPDGRLVAYTRVLADRTALVLGPADRPEKAVEVASPGFVPRFSPDGTWLAFTTSDPNGGEGTLLCRSIPAGKVRRLTPDPMQMYGLAWLPDGRSLVISGRSGGGRFVLWRVPLSGGPPEPMTLGVGDFSSPAVSPDGSLLAFAHGNDLANLVVADGPREPEGRSLTDDEYHRWPRLSPDGRLVASVLQRAGVVDELVVTDVATRRRTKLADGDARHPCWVDARTVAYLSRDGDGTTRVATVDVASLSAGELTRFDFAARSLAVAPGGKRIAVARPEPGTAEALVVRDLDARSDREVARGQAYHGLRFGPSGELAWSGPHRSGTPATNGVFLLPAGAAAPVRLAPDGYGPLFAPDGSAVLFARADEFGGLYRVPVSGGEPVKLRAFGRGVSDFDRVGDRLAWAQESGRNQVYVLPLK